MKKVCCNNRKALTLTEVMIAMVVLTIATAGVVLPYSAGAAVRIDAARRTLAVKLAGDLLEDIVATDFDSIVDDYDGYGQAVGDFAGGMGSLITADSATYAGFSRIVSCQYVYVSQQDGTASPNFVRITVSTYYQGQLLASLNCLKSR